MAQNDQDQRLTGRFYTRARRFKQVLGSLPDGTRIIGGPYSYTQIVVFLGAVILGWATRGLWGTESTIRDLIVLIAVSVGLMVVIGKLPSSRRSLLKLLGGAMNLLSHPGPGGKYQGRPVKLSTKSQKILRETQKAAKNARKQNKTNAPVTHEEPAQDPQPDLEPTAITAGYGSSIHRLLKPAVERNN